MIGACKGERVGTRKGIRILKKFHVGGGVSPMGIFFLCGQSFLSTWGPFFPCVGGGVSFSAWGGGGSLLGFPPITIFAGTSCCHIFYCTDIYNLPRSWKFEFFWRELFDPPKKIAPPPVPTKINNLCTPPWSTFLLLTLLSLSYNPHPGPACFPRNNLKLLKSRPPSLNPPPSKK